MKILKKVISVMAAGMMSALLAFGAAAAENQLDFNQLKATVSVTGASFSDETFGLVLESLDGAPMPSGSTDGTKRYQTGVLNSDTRSETLELGSITYTEPGIYEYNLTETAGTTELMGYDSTTYHIFVKVLNNDDMTGLKLEALWVSKNDSNEKLDAISFENVKTAPGGSSSGGSGGGGGSNTGYHSVTPNGGSGDGSSTDGPGNDGDVLGVSRNPIEQIADAVGQVLGATRKAVQTGDSSMMIGMGLGFLACLGILAGWFVVWKKRKKDVH